MVSQSHIWRERISTNLFLTGYLVSKGEYEMIGLDQRQKGNGVFKREKKLQKKNLFHKMQSVENLSAECQD